MAAGGAEEHFAKKLANNEKKIRDRAVNKLRAWIRSRPKDGPGFDEVDLLKIWKGLFYCVWMSDKPLIQEELALNISQLILSFRNEQSAVLFIKTFFKTMQREWHGIDRLRLDKFYLLIRFFVKETFNFLKKTGWEDRLVTEVKGIFQEEPLDPTSQTVPDGIRLHMVAVYLTELGSVVDDQIHCDVLLNLLDPLFSLAAHSNNKTVTNAVKKSLSEHLVESDRDNSDEKQGTIMAKVDFAAVADRLFTLASDRNILSRNRKQLFQWAKRFRKNSEGEHKEGQPVQQEEISNGLPVVSKPKSAAYEATDLTNTSVNEGGNGKKNELSRGKTKRKKRKQVDLENEQQNNSSFDLESTDEITKRKRKINKDESLGHNALFLGGEGTLGEVNAEPKKKKKNLKSKSESDDRTITSKKPRQSDHKDSNEGSDIVNGNHENEDEMLTSDTLPQTDKLSSIRSSDISVVNADASSSPEKAESALSTAVEKRVLRKAASRNSEPFAQFQKSSTPLAFVRKCLSRTPRSEPQRRETNDVQGHTPGSVPAKGAHKRVRIEVSKNTAHTTQDYQRSLKESPKIPFDAKKTPIQGLLKSLPGQVELKSPPKPRRTPLHVNKTASSSEQRKPKQAKSAKRPTAVDFF